MKLFRETNHLKFIILSFILLLIFGIFNIIITNIQYRQYVEVTNTKINSLVYELKKNYPNIKEETIIEMLNSNNTENIFNIYGIDLKKDSILLEYETIRNNTILSSILLLITYSCSILIIYLYYHNKNRKKMDQITNYIKEINQKNYYLDIMDNSEDELSILKNEIYKTTVMLKEQAENLKNDHLILKESLSNISHQLKTPLTSISLMLDNIIENPNMEECIRNEFIYDIKKEINNIEFLVQNLLKLSKFEANAVEFKKEKIVVKELINKVLKNLEIMIELKNMNIIFNDSENIYFKGDFRWEAEALTNILKNCIEHSKADSNIIIHVEKNEFYVQILIQDFGVGIPSKDIKNIFKRFFTSENSLSDSIGIGLNLAKKIIEKDNGYISVESEKDVGTTFVIKYYKKEI